MAAHQAPPSPGFSKQERWSGLPFPPPGYIPNGGTEPTSPALAGRFFTIEPPGKPFPLLIKFNVARRILITHQCHCYQKKNPQKSLFSTLCFSCHYHHQISHVVFGPKSQGWKGEMRSPYEFIFPCWILEGSIAEFVTNSVGLIPGISVMLQNTPTDFLMKWTCNESHMEKSVTFTACDSVVGWSHTYIGNVPWS